VDELNCFAVLNIPAEGTRAHSQEDLFTSPNSGTMPPEGVFDAFSAIESFFE
jgi:hypothetical protein